MPLTGPRVRSACESCHKRKVRCLLMPGREACQNCSASGSQCLFAPRVKTGRPRLGRPLSSPMQSPLSHDAFETPLNPQIEPIHFLQNQNSTATTLSDSRRQIESSRIQIEEPHNLHKASLQSMPDLRPLALQAVGMQNYTTSSDDGGSASTDSMLADPLLDRWNPLLPISPPPSMPSDVASPLPSTPSNSAEGPEPNFDFSAGLQLCTKLDRHCHHIRNANHYPETLHDVLSTMGPACTAAIKAASCTSASALASSALVLASVYKIFQICELIIGRATDGAPIPDVQAMEHMLVLKTLDLALLHGREFLIRTGQSEAARKASQLHRYLEMLVKQQDRWWSQ